MRYAGLADLYFRGSLNGPLKQVWMANSSGSSSGQREPSGMDNDIPASSR